MKSGRKGAAQLSNATSSAFDEGLTPHSRVVVPRFTENNERTARQLLSLDPSNRSASAAPSTRSHHTMAQPAPTSHSSHSSSPSQAHLIVQPILLPNAVSSPAAAEAPPSTPGSTGVGTDSPSSRQAAGGGGNVPATPQSTARATSYNKENVECRAHIVRLLDQDKIEQQWAAFVEHKLGHGTMATALAKCDPGTPRMPGSGRRRRRTASASAKRGRKAGSGKRGKRRGSCGASSGDRAVKGGDGGGGGGGGGDDEEQPAASRVSEELERLSQEFGQALSKLRASDWHYLQTGSLTLMHIIGQVDGAASAADDSASVQQPDLGSSESLSPDSTAAARDSKVQAVTSLSAEASSQARELTMLPTMYGMFPREAPQPHQHRTHDSNLYHAEQHQYSSSQPQSHRPRYLGGQGGGASVSSFQDTRRQRSGVDIDQAMRLANQDIYDPMHHQGDTGGFQLTQSTIPSSQGSVDTPAVAAAVLQGASVPQRGHARGSHHHAASGSGGFGRGGQSQGLYGNQHEDSRQFQYLARSGSLVQELTNFAPSGQGGAQDGVSFSQQSGHSLTRTSSLVSSLGGADDTEVDPELGRTASTMHHMPAPTRHGSLHSWRQAPLTSHGSQEERSLNDDSRQAPLTAGELEVDPTSEVQRTTAMPVPQFRGVSRAAVMTQWTNDDDNTDSTIVNHHDMEPSLAGDLSPDTTIATSGAGGPFHYESIEWRTGPGGAGNLGWDTDSAAMLQSHQLKASASAGATTGASSAAHPRASGKGCSSHTDHRRGASTTTGTQTVGSSGRQLQPFTTPQVGSTVPRTQAGHTRAHGPRSAGAVHRSTARYSEHHKADMLSPALTIAEPEDHFGQYAGTEGRSASSMVRAGRLDFNQPPHAADGATLSSNRPSHDNRPAGHDEEHDGVDLRADQDSLCNMSDGALSLSSFGLANSFDGSGGGRHGTFEQPSAEGTGGTLTASGSHAPSPSKRARGKKKPADAARLGGSGSSHFSAGLFGDENMPPAHHASERGGSLSTAELQSLLSDAHTGGAGGQPWRARDAAPLTSPREAVAALRRSFVLGTKNALQFTIQPAAAASGTSTTRAASGRPQSGLRASVVVKSGGTLRAEHVLLTDSQTEGFSPSGQGTAGHTGQEDVEEIDVLHDSIYTIASEVRETASKSRQSRQARTTRPHGSGTSSMQAVTPVVHTASTSLGDMASAALAVAGTSPGSTVVFSPISPLASKQIEKPSRNSDPNASLQEMFGSPALRPNSDEQDSFGITPPGASGDKRRLTRLLGSGETNTSSSSEHSHLTGLQASTPLQLHGVVARTPGSAFGGPPSSGGSEPCANPPLSGMASSSSGRRRKRSDSSGMYTLGDIPAVPSELRADGGVSGMEELVVYQDGNSPPMGRGAGAGTGTGAAQRGKGKGVTGDMPAAHGSPRGGSSSGHSSSTRSEQQMQSENRAAGGPGRLQLQSPLVGRPFRRMRKVAGPRARVRDGGGKGSGDGQDQSGQQDVATFFGERT